MKKTIAWLILAAWVVVILGLLTIVFVQAPVVILGGGLALLTIGAFVALLWAIDEVGYIEL